MIPATELRRSAESHLEDAQVLLSGNRYDGAIYVCGYAIELAFKAKICSTLKWTDGFPFTNKEFEGLTSFKTHNFEILLRLSGESATIRTMHAAEWSVVANWNPESRYNRSGKSTKADAESMIESAKKLLSVI